MTTEGVTRTIAHWAEDLARLDAQVTAEHQAIEELLNVANELADKIEANTQGPDDGSRLKQIMHEVRERLGFANRVAVQGVTMSLNQWEVAVDYMGQALDRLQRVGIWVVVLTMAGVGIGITGAWTSPTAIVVNLSTIAIGVLTISSLIQWSRIRAEALDLAATMNDSLQRLHVAYMRLTKDQGGQLRLEQMFDRSRVQLAKLTRLTDLPLIPGEFGPRLYVAINAGSMIWALIRLFTAH